MKDLYKGSVILLVVALVNAAASAVWLHGYLLNGSMHNLILCFGNATIGLWTLGMCAALVLID